MGASSTGGVTNNYRILHIRNPRNVKNALLMRKIAFRHKLSIFVGGCFCVEPRLA